MTSPLPATRWSRRRLLAGGAALLAGLAGCTPGPEEPGPRPSGPSGGGTPAGGGSPVAPPPPSFPGAVQALAQQQAVVAAATLALAAGRDDLDRAGRRLLTRVRDQHQAQADALRAPDPTDPATVLVTAPSATPSPTPSGRRPSFAAALDSLEQATRRAGTGHLRRSRDSTGLAALLWGSLATGSTATATLLEAADLAGDDPDPGAGTLAVTGRRPMPVVGVVEAEQQLVRQLHAVVYGYQLALGRLTGSRRDAAATGLRRHRVLRDALTARLLDRGADVPVADAAYVPSTTPRNAATAATLVRQLETALLPFCGLWLAAADTAPERAQALEQLGRTGALARQWGGALPTWPGWSPA